MPTTLVYKNMFNNFDRLDAPLTLVQCKLFCNALKAIDCTFTVERPALLGPDGRVPAKGNTPTLIICRWKGKDSLYVASLRTRRQAYDFLAKYIDSHIRVEDRGRPPVMTSGYGSLGTYSITQWKEELSTYAGPWAAVAAFVGEDYDDGIMQGYVVVHPPLLPNYELHVMSDSGLFLVIALGSLLYS